MSNFEDILNNISPEEKHPNDRVLLIDGLNIFLRAFAVNGSLNEKGVPVGGIMGFMKSQEVVKDGGKLTQIISHSVFLNE